MTFTNEKAEIRAHEIEKTKAEIQVLTKKLSFLEDMQKHQKSPAEIAFKIVYGHYPVTDIADTCWEGQTWFAFQQGYHSAKEDYKYQPTPQEPEQVEQGLRDAMKQAKEDGVFDEPKPETLYEALTNLGYIDGNCDEIVDAVEKWLPKEQSAKGSQNVYVECTVDGFNDCLKKIKQNLQ